ncbi:MAG: RNase adapter RapZ [Eubacterium sp.]|nr:RNase adapter RapZ [Eubacterium sp.]
MHCRDCVIVTGMSGAGKSTALDFFRDNGWFCVDNIPPQLIGQCIGLAEDAGEPAERMACGIDIRIGTLMQGLDQMTDVLKARGIRVRILYLDADTKTLIRRCKETRRAHPVAGAGQLEDGIRKERGQLSELKKRADHVIDTSRLLTRELRQMLREIFCEGASFSGMNVTVLSFGFKYGIPRDADLVFDVRFLPNPYYVEELRLLTGKEAEVQSYVLDNEAAAEFLERLTEMIRFLLPLYTAEGKTQLVIAVGCTGGRHRSVAVAEALYAALCEREKAGVRLEHRDTTFSH